MIAKKWYVITKRFYAFYICCNIVNIAATTVSIIPVSPDKLHRT